MKDSVVRGKIILKPIFESIKLGNVYYITLTQYMMKMMFFYVHGSASSALVQPVERCYIIFFRKRCVTDLVINKI